MRSTRAPTASESRGASESGVAGFSVVPRQKKLQIVGIIEREPEAGFGGFGRTLVYIPLPVARSLQATQISDLRDVLQGPNAGGGQRYASLTVRVKSSGDVVGIENEIKNMGFRTFSLFDASRNLRLLFALLDLLLLLPLPSSRFPNRLHFLVRHGIKLRPTAAQPLCSYAAEPYFFTSAAFSAGWSV